MSKIYCPYVVGRKFDDLDSAFNCSDCAYGCKLVENILRPVLYDLIRQIALLQKDDDE